MDNGWILLDEPQRRPQGKEVATVWVVIVTYGERYMSLTAETLHRALAADATGVTVVDNGLHPAHAAELDAAAARDPRINVIKLGRNTGSAGGFRSGLRDALARASDFILMLDDDNWISGDFIQKSLALHGTYGRLLGTNELAVLGNRTLDNNHQRLVRGTPPRITFPPPGAFLSFDLVTYMKRVFFHRSRRPFTEPVIVPSAPYGGLMVPATVVRRVGLPREDFFLYADDTEWSSRIHDAGVPICFMPDCEVVDADAKWSREAGKGPRGILRSPSLIRIYYGTRNQTFLERTMLHTSGPRVRYAINRAIYFTFAYLIVISDPNIRHAQWSQFKTAVSDGDAGRLGEASQARIMGETAYEDSLA